MNETSNLDGDKNLPASKGNLNPGSETDSIHFV